MDKNMINSDAPAGGAPFTLHGCADEGPFELAQAADKHTGTTLEQRKFIMSYLENLEADVEFEEGTLEEVATKFLSDHRVA